MSDSSSAGASSRLINLARTIDPQIEGQLKPVVDEYRRVGAELLSSEKTADANQLKIYREALLAMISEPEKYTAEYTRLQGAYGAALDELRGAVSKESAARDQWQKDPAHRVPELTALLVEFGTEELDSLRSGIIRTNPETARKDLTEAESALQSVTTDPRAAAYLKSVRATDALVLKLADARAAFTGLLDRRDAELTKQYPEWRTWWVLLTCSRHPSADHLDFGSTANR